MNRVTKTGIAAALVVFLLISAAFVRYGDIYFQIKKQLTIFSDLYKEVATLYVDEVPPETLMKKGIDAMLRELDPYTVFISEGEQQQMEILSTGGYGGIGVDAGFRGNDIVIIAPLEGYPAQRAGLRPGDVIRAINDVSVDGFTPEEVQELTIGDVGTKVRIKIYRPATDQEIEYELERERIEVRNIAHADTIGEQQDVSYIQLSRFGQQAAEEVREKLLKAKEEQNLKGIVLDLRNNPGGLLNEAVDIVDKFIEPGVTVVETIGRITSQNNAFVSEEPAIFDELPVVVLMNRGSASASEVVAGALQDLDRAVVIGEGSFGKGLVQTIRPLPYNTSLKITVSKYYTPSGRSIQSINYSGDDSEWGSTVADSLRRSFQTKNGRTVFDGQGIMPDIQLEHREESRAEAAMLQNNHFFFFVNKLLGDDADEVVLPDDLFDKFVVYLDENDFDYETPADRTLRQLQENARFFDDESAFNSQMAALKKLADDKKWEEMQASKSFIEKEIMKEWISQREGSTARYRYLLQSDDAVLKALELFADTEQYKSVLTP